MQFPDKLKLSKENNQKLAIKHMDELIYTNALFEGVKLSFDQLVSIVLGSDLYGVSDEDMAVIRRLQGAVELLIRNVKPYTLTVSHEINARITKGEAIEAGKLRTGKLKLAGTTYLPPIPDAAEVENQVNRLIAGNQSVTERAIRLMLYLLKAQLYWAGNRRTAVLTANYFLIEHGAGLIVIQPEQLRTFNQRLLAYYEEDDMVSLLTWVYENCLVTSV